ncbi:uncharacterized protein Dana_GF26664 [Drosophila ananassae]|uniref:Uncharacterized protein n=1 Tax=Drosophila ananassae TaxID=7217 RepID=A0A0P8ZX28_DROAN|nr:uncharacterized protein Dana_GF26664 [Drosophila ananassae]
MERSPTQEKGDGYSYCKYGIHLPSAWSSPRTRLTAACQFLRMPGCEWSVPGLSRN